MLYLPGPRSRLWKVKFSPRVGFEELRRKRKRSLIAGNAASKTSGRCYRCWSRPRCCAIRVYTTSGQYDLRAITVPPTNCLSLSSHEEIYEAWFSEFLGQGPSGHFRRGVPGESPTFVLKRAQQSQRTTKWPNEESRGFQSPTPRGKIEFTCFFSADLFVFNAKLMAGCWSKRQCGTMTVARGDPHRQTRMAIGGPMLHSIKWRGFYAYRSMWHQSLSLAGAKACMCWTALGIISNMTSVQGKISTGASILWILSHYTSITLLHLSGARLIRTGREARKSWTRIGIASAGWDFKQIKVVCSPWDSIRGRGASAFEGGSLRLRQSPSPASDARGRIDAKELLRRYAGDRVCYRRFTQTCAKLI